MFVKKVTIANMGPFGPSPVSSSNGYSFKEGRHCFTFKHGSVGIFGANGVGKTTLVDLIYAAITNNFNRFDGVKADCVNHLSGKDDPAFVSVVMEHESATIGIVRGVRGTKFSMVINGEDRVVPYSASEADAKLKSVGIDTKILDFCVFKRQPGSEKNAIDDFLRTTPTARAEAYMALNGTQHCDVIYDALGDMINHDRELNTQIVDNSDELVSQIGSLKETLEAYKAQREEQKALKMKSDHKVKAEEIIAVAAGRPSIEKRKKELNESVSSLEKELKTARLREAERKKLLEDLDAQLVVLTKSAAAAKKATEDWGLYDATTGRRKQLEQDKAAHIKKLSELVKPKQVLEHLTMEDLISERTLWQEKLAAAKKSMATFCGTGLTECPTCGTEVAAFEDKLQELEAVTKKAPIVLQDYNARIVELNTYSHLLQAYNSKHPVLTAKVQHCDEMLAALPLLKKPSLSKSECAVVEQLDEVKADRETCQEAYKLAVQKASSYVGAISQAKQLLVKVDSDLDLCNVDVELLARAKTRLAEHREAELELAVLKGKISGVESQIADKEEQLSFLRKKIKKSKKLKQAVATLSRVREAFHKTSLPQKVAQANLALMEEDINKNLEQFGGQFWVETDKDLSFLIHKPGEPPHRAERLSGGQKVVLALSFWPAVNSLYRTGLGMLVLDEPTANLDDDNTTFLREALSKLTKQVRGNRQVIMISHADVLKTSFDQVIALTR